LKGGILAKAKFYTGTQAKIDAKAIENGAIYAATDKNVLAVDVNNKRVSLDADAISTNSSDISSLKETVANKSDSNHTHSLADLSGVAAAAQKLANSSGVGLNTDSLHPVYFSSGTPIATKNITVKNNGSAIYATKLIKNDSDFASWDPTDPTPPDTYSIGSSSVPVYFKDGIPVELSQEPESNLVGNPTGLFDGEKFVNMNTAYSAAALQACRLMGDNFTDIVNTGSENQPVYFSEGIPKAISSVAIENGGTGATTASMARTNLGLGSAALRAATTSISSGSASLPTSNAVYNALSGKAASDVVTVSSEEPSSATCLIWIQTS
jgi:hypothetical protein